MTYVSCDIYICVMSRVCACKRHPHIDDDDLGYRIIGHLFFSWGGLIWAEIDDDTLGMTSPALGVITSSW